MSFYLWTGAAVALVFGVRKLKEGKMEKDLLEGQLGPEAKYDVEFKGGKLVAKLDYTGKLLGAGVKVEIPASAILEAVKAAIPGKADDVLMDFLKKLLEV